MTRTFIFAVPTYPPVGSKVLNYDEDHFEIIEQGITRYKHLGKLYVIGDFNSRTSTEPDYLDYEKYLEDEDDLTNICDFRFRSSKDHVLDAHGKRLLLLCQTTSE